IAGTCATVLAASNQVDFNLDCAVVCANGGGRFVERLAKHTLSRGFILQQGSGRNVWRCVCCVALRRTAGLVSLRLVETGPDDGWTRPRGNNAWSIDHGFAICRLCRSMATSR